MPPLDLHVHRQNRGSRTLFTLVGQIDLATAPLLRTSLATCLHDGTRTVDVDLAAVTFCDVSGLNVFLAASELTKEAGMILRLHRPPQSLTRVVEVTDSGFLIHSLRPTGAPEQPTFPVPGGAL
ncbi:STAS domain-containing protein [Streptomyces sp. NPDC051207]|uniref:STAS domain-containing protein n=1 Tax=Streptomyces sp. NPDC051207 TaxID=3154641 RepID=UPI003443007E